MRIQHAWDLLYVLTQKEIKIRYKNSVLGYFWSIAHPLAFAMVFFIAFKVVMRIKMENYTLFLIAGLFPWQWFTNSINASPLVFHNNSTIIKKVLFPWNILPMVTVMQDMFHFMLSIPIIIAFLFVYHGAPTIAWLYGIPLLLIIQSAFMYGLVLIISSVNLFFRDLERLIIIATSLVFYFTPIIYPVSMVPEQYQKFLSLNPLVPIITGWQNLFLKGYVEPLQLFLGAVYAFTAVILGHAVYSKLSWRFAEIL